MVDSTRSLRGLSCFVIVVLGLVGSALIVRGLVVMPGKRVSRPLPKLSSEQEELVFELQRDLQVLVDDIGQRHAREPEGLERALAFVEEELAASGLPVQRHTFEHEGVSYHNLEIEWPGTAAPNEIVIIGAHYDTVPFCPGADDNGSGVVALLALARRFAERAPERTLRLVAFTNEESLFDDEPMGSRFYAQRCRARGEKVVAMLSLETIGYYSDEAGSQQYPSGVGLLYPDTGDFIAFVGNLGSRGLVRRCVRTFRKHGALPAEGGALPSWIPGVAWSDHASFWRQDYPGVMVTDTAPFRNPHYHSANDTLETIDFERLARAVDGIDAVVIELARAPGSG